MRLATLGKKEIGSEFWDVPISNKENGIFRQDTRWFISGTAALESIIIDICSEKKIKNVAIPSWCCGCMASPFLKHGIEVKFYPVYVESGRLICDYSCVVADCWLILSYFGYASQNNIGTPSGIIIRDITHSIFGNYQKDADYYFGSLRKWAGFYTGGYAWSDKWNDYFNYPDCDPYFITLRENAMSQKQSYINGQSDSKAYLSIFEKGEEFLDCCEPMKAYELDIAKAQHLDISFLTARRNSNARVLLSSLEKWAIFPEVCDTDCPLFVPILLEPERRDSLRLYLKKHSIYCPIHWSIEKAHRLTSKTRELYDQELSIVCDQRYDEDDMERIIQVITDSGII